MVNVGVYTRGNLEDYQRWGGEELWSVNRTLENFRELEASSSAPGYEVDYDYHPYDNPRGYQATLVSSDMNELNPLFKDLPTCQANQGQIIYNMGFY